MDPLVTIETYSRVIDARLAQARLESAGIATFLLDESVASIDPFLINAIGGVKLQVKLADEEAARDLLRHPLADETADDVDVDAPRCPRCDSEYVFETSGTTKCKRCKYAGAIEEFAPRAKAAPTSSAAGQPAASARAPVFRLERRRGLIGGLAGFVVGFLVTVVVPSVGTFALALGALAGFAIGRAVRYWVCSEPTCRRPLRANDRACEHCGRPVRGTITREEEHFIRVAEWKRDYAKAN
jgi:hypothetical protein